MDTRFPEPGSSLVQAMVAGQFPEWAGLEIRPVELSGWDNRTFHLGDSLLVRMPSAAHYVAQVEKEQRWLPILSQSISLPIPMPVAAGLPCAEFPHPWSIYKWLPGDTLSASPDVDQRLLATSIAGFLCELQAISISDAPRAGAHCFYRGGDLTIYDAETQQALLTLSHDIDVKSASRIWNLAITSPVEMNPVWFHGDIAPGNLLIKDGQLSAVIDFGCCGVGDPACDLAISWTDFDLEARECFFEVIGCDNKMCARAMGWALWKALIIAAGCPEKCGPTWQRAMKTINVILGTA